MTTPALDDRYGRTSSPAVKRLSWTVLGIIAVLFFGYIAWGQVSSNMKAVSSDGLGYAILDDKTVEVSFQVTAPRGHDVVCALEALDEEFGVVGYSIVSYPASENHAQKFTEEIRTVAPATTGLVSDCWVP